MLRWMRFVGRDVSRYEVDGMDPVSLVSKPGRVDAGAATDDEDLAGRSLWCSQFKLTESRRDSFLLADGLIVVHHRVASSMLRS